MMSSQRPPNPTRILAWACLLAVPAVIGCAESAARTVPPSNPAKSQDEPKAAVADAPQDKVVKRTWRPSPGTKLPFPDRQELFVPPSQAALARVPRQTGGPDLVLRGFANVGKRRAMLEIEGTVMVLGEGEENRGIRILSIDPPRVTIQRSGQRWTESLYREEMIRPGLSGSP